METNEELGRQLKNAVRDTGGFSADGEIDFDRVIGSERAVTRSEESVEGGGNMPEVTVNIPEIRIPQQNINLSISLDGYELTRAVARATDEMNRQLNTRLIR